MSERGEVPIEVQLDLRDTPWKGADFFHAPVQGLMVAMPVPDGIAPPLFIVAGDALTDEMRECMAALLSEPFKRAGAAEPLRAATEEVSEMETRAHRDPDGYFILLAPTEWMSDGGLAEIRRRT